MNERNASSHRSSARVAAAERRARFEQRRKSQRVAAALWIGIAVLLVAIAAVAVSRFEKISGAATAVAETINRALPKDIGQEDLKAWVDRLHQRLLQFDSGNAGPMSRRDFLDVQERAAYQLKRLERAVLEEDQFDAKSAIRQLEVNDREFRNRVDGKGLEAAVKASEGR